ncbi:hypothetical protein BC629DRAFT_1283475, partial [Irpex lacteus]
LQQYFDGFPGFHYDQGSEVMPQFDALSEQQGWEENFRKEQLLVLKTAIALRFNEILDDDEDDLPTWQRLCNTMGIDPIPETVVDCKKVHLRTHVSLVDLVDAYHRSGSVRTFGSRAAFEEKRQNIPPR